MAQTTNPSLESATSGRFLAVSPFHEIPFPEDYADVIQHPQRQDFTIRTLSRKLVNGQPLVTGELVIAGKETRDQYPLAREYPLHFRKTYYPTAFHQDPAREFELHETAAGLIEVPPPIGFTRTSFRSCFIPGKPLDKLSPFGVEPQDRNIGLASEAGPAALIGLWKLMEAVYADVRTLHENGFSHGDLFLHNMIVSLNPLRPFIIDFELAVKKDEAEEARWQKSVKADLYPLLEQAVYVQTGLGPLGGPLGEASRAAIEGEPGLFGDPGRFLRAIEREHAARKH